MTEKYIFVGGQSNWLPLGICESVLFSLVDSSTACENKIIAYDTLCRRQYAKAKFNKKINKIIKKTKSRNRSS